MNPSQDLRAIGRNADGTAGVGNLLALKHGAYARQLVTRPELQAEIASREREVVADLGGAEQLSAVMRQLVTRYVQTGVIADALAADVFDRGPLTSKGRARAAVSLFLQVLDRQHRLALALGLERRTRRVPTLEEWAAQQQRATQSPQNASGAPAVRDIAPDVDRPAAAAARSQEPTL